MILLLLACAPEPEPDRSTSGTDPVPRPSPEPQTTPTPEPGPPTPCDLRTPGFICRWMGQEGIALFADIEGEHRLDAYLNLPVDLEFGPDGTPYIVDWNNHRIRVVDPDDTVRTIVGVGVIGDGVFDPWTGLWSGGLGREFKLNHPTGLAFHASDPTGMYIAAWHNSRVLRYDFTTLEVEYFAGTGYRSYAGEGVPALEASFDLVSSLAFDDVGNLWVADQANQLIRVVDATLGTVSAKGGVLETPGYNGDGPALETWLNGSVGGWADPATRLTWSGGKLYLVDTENNLVRVLEPHTGRIDTVAGTWLPNPVLQDTNGDNIGDLQLGLGGYAGDGGPAIEARLNRPRDLAFGPNGSLYVADTESHCIRVIDPDGIIHTFAGQCGVEGWYIPIPEDADGDGRLDRDEDLDGDGILDPFPPASMADEVVRDEALLSHPFGVAVDPAGNVYVADTWNQVIRVIWAEPGPETP